jgi:pyruvate kinase
MPFFIVKGDRMERVHARILKRTKIVATLGPTSNTEHTIEQLIKNGLNVARLNFSHNTHEDHLKNLTMVRKVSERLGKPVAVFQDLQGPKIRLGNLLEDIIMLEKEQKVTLFLAKDQQDERIPVQFDMFPYIKEGDRVLINDGAIRLSVDSVDKDERSAVCSVRVAGPIKSRKGVNLPDTKLPSIAFTEKDRIDLMFGLEHKVDYVGLSFVQDADDIDNLRKIINKSDHRPKIVAKIETREAVKNLKAIIETSDVVMVARGDLAVEIDQEDVPLIQREIIRLSRKYHTPVIVATQMLESMINSPEPTRAEVNDVATAVLEHVDAVMLSAETASGSYPVEAVSMMKRIIKRVERHHRDTLTDYALATLEESTDQTTAIAAASSILAHQLKAELIIVATTSGKTAARVASYRPPVPIIAITDEELTYRQLTMIWGTKAFYLPNVKENPEGLNAIIGELKERGFVAVGDKVVYVTGANPYEEEGTSIVKVDTIR